MPTYSRRAKEPALVALGAAIRRIRAARQMSQEELALVAGLDRSYLGNIERGESNITVLSLASIAAALGQTASGVLEQAGL